MTLRHCPTSAKDNWTQNPAALKVLPTESLPGDPTGETAPLQVAPLGTERHVGDALMAQLPYLLGSSIRQVSLGLAQRKTEIHPLTSRKSLTKVVSEPLPPLMWRRWQGRSRTAWPAQRGLC